MEGNLCELKHVKDVKRRTTSKPFKKDSVTYGERRIFNEGDFPV